MFAANVDPVESDPRPLDRLALAGLLADEFSYTDATETDAGAVSSPAAQELAPRLADLALLLLLCETWMAMRFGAGR